MENVSLDGPIAFIDLETTGLSISTDRIIELTVLKIHPDGSEELKSVRVSPGMPIPAEATAVHGITNEDVADKPKFRQYAVSLKDFLADCDYAGFNIKRFDLPLLEAEFKRSGVEFSTQDHRVLDAQVIYHSREPRDLAAAYRKYCAKELQEAHTSMGDVRAAYEILDAQLHHYPDLPRDVAGLHEFCNPREPNWIDAEGRFVWVEEEAAFGFGQYKGKLLKEIANLDSDYLNWISGTDFPDEVKKIASEALSNRFPRKLSV